MELGRGCAHQDAVEDTLFIDIDSAGADLVKLLRTLQRIGLDQEKVKTITKLLSCTADVQVYRPDFGFNQFLDDLEQLIRKLSSSSSKIDRMKFADVIFEATIGGVAAGVMNKNTTTITITTITYTTTTTTNTNTNTSTCTGHTQTTRALQRCSGVK